MDENEMLNFVKAIADTDRLRIVGLLTQKSARLSEICGVLGFHPADAQHHLDQLLRNGVVGLNEGVYELNAESLEKLSRRQFEGERSAYTPEVDLGKNRRRILAAYLNPDGTIKQIPFQPAKLQIILDYLINAFTVGANYTEKEVNLILAHFNPDTSGLRRDLVDAGMLERKRDGSRELEAKMNAELVVFFKALADANRLKIVGLLARQEYSVEELAALLNLKAPTISHHLSKLAEAGLVSARAEGYYSIYQLNKAALETTARGLFSNEQMNSATEDVDLDAYDRKVLADFSLPDGRLSEIPSQRRKLEAILHHVVKSFKPGVKYSEKQVNEALARFHADTATLRRELVGYGLMKRETGGREYWIEEVLE